MDNDIQKKLAALRDEYAKSLPGKIDEIQSLTDSLKEKVTPDKLVELHRKVHSLHGSSLTYGFKKLGESAANLENLVYQLKSSNLITPMQFDKIYHHINEFKIQISQPVVVEQPQATAQLKNHSHTLFVLDDGKIWDSNLQQQLNVFGYEIIKFDNRDDLVKVIKQSKPAILIINIKMLNKQLQDILHQINESTPIPLLFISVSGEFSLRLKAAQMNGKAFLVNPFPVEDLVSYIEPILKPDTEKYRVLIIDDEIDVANYNAMILNNANMKTHIITQSADVDQALHDFKPDIILIDLYMPECSGMELASVIRQQRTYQSIPIIFLSAEEDEFKQLTAMQFGADDFIKKSSKPEHLILAIKNRTARYKSFNTMMVKDSLTGAYNHTFILHQLDVEVTDAVRRYNPLSIAIIDLDNLKRINDTFGYVTGDQILQDLNLILSNRLRSTDLIGRYSSTEFLVILPNTDTELAYKLLDQLREQFISLHFSSNNQLFNMTFSAGIASFPPYTKSDTLINGACDALKNAKKSGRNKVEKSK